MKRRLPSSTSQDPPVSLSQVGVSLADEFNNVLMAIQSLAEAIHKQVPDNPTVASKVSEITVAIHRGKEISRQILRYTERSSDADQPVNLSQLLREFAPTVEVVAGKEIPVEADRSDEKFGVAEVNLRKIVLVEDDSLVSTGLSAILDLEGINVTVAERGADALSAIERASPDAVVLDIGLPDIDGVEVYKQIAQRWPRLPVLFSSGHGVERNLAEYVSHPHVGFLMKPYEVESLLAALRKLIAAA